MTSILFYPKKSLKSQDDRREKNLDAFPKEKASEMKIIEISPQPTHPSNDITRPGCLKRIKES